MIPTISQNILVITEVPLRSQESSESAYRTKVEQMLVNLSTLSNQLGPYGTQANTLASWMNDLSGSMMSYVDEKGAEIQAQYSSIIDFKSEIVNVSDNMAKISNIDSNMDKVTALTTNLPMLTTLHTNIAIFQQLDDNLDDLTRLDTNLPTLITLSDADYMAAVSTTANNMPKVVNVSDNMAAIIDALEQSSSSSEPVDLSMHRAIIHFDINIL